MYLELFLEEFVFFKEWRKKKMLPSQVGDLVKLTRVAFQRVLSYAQQLLLKYVLGGSFLSSFQSEFTFTRCIYRRVILNKLFLSYWLQFVLPNFPMIDLVAILLTFNYS